MNETKVQHAAEDVRKTIIDLDTALQLASRTYHGKRIRELVSEDFTLVSSSGRVLHADAFIAEVEDRSVTWFNNDTEDIDVRLYGADCAIVVAVLHSCFEVEGRITDSRFRYTDTWVKQEETWRYVAGHACMLERVQ